MLSQAGKLSTCSAVCRHACPSHSPAGLSPRCWLHAKLLRHPHLHEQLRLNALHMQQPCSMQSKALPCTTSDLAVCTQGVGLCHGISGNAYSFLSLYRLTRDEKWLHRACSFALFMATYLEQLLPVPQEPFSLFEVSHCSEHSWDAGLQPAHSGSNQICLFLCGEEAELTAHS